nr:hypothetical protein MmNV_84 [Menippe mercenaria nudivirus]
MPGVACENIWKTHYANVRLLSCEVISDLKNTVYTPRELELHLTDPTNVLCHQCGFMTFGKGECINRNCITFHNDHLYKRVKLGETLLNLSDLNYKDIQVACPKCSKCKRCKKIKTGDPCYMHKVCNHNRSVVNYRKLNKSTIVIKQS